MAAHFTQSDSGRYTTICCPEMIAYDVYESDMFSQPVNEPSSLW